MRNYAKEIGELRKDINKLSDEIFKIVVERNVLTDNPGIYGRLVRSSVGTILLNTKYWESERVEKLLMDHDRYEKLGVKLDELRDIHRTKLDEYEALKDEWRKIHTREFYRPMDEIDICNLISKDGFIIGVKF